jgi:hypothetical protein
LPTTSTVAANTAAVDALARDFVAIDDSSDSNRFSSMFEGSLFAGMSSASSASTITSSASAPAALPLTGAVAYRAVDSHHATTRARASGAASRANRTLSMDRLLMDRWNSAPLTAAVLPILLGTTPTIDTAGRVAQLASMLALDQLLAQATDLAGADEEMSPHDRFDRDPAADQQPRSSSSAEAIDMILEHGDLWDNAESAGDVDE